LKTNKFTVGDWVSYAVSDLRGSFARAILQGMGQVVEVRESGKVKIKRINGGTVVMPPRSVKLLG